MSTPIIQTLETACHNYGQSQAAHFCQGEQSFGGSPMEELTGFLARKDVEIDQLETAGRDRLYDAYLEGVKSEMGCRLTRGDTVTNAASSASLLVKAFAEPLKPSQGGSVCEVDRIPDLLNEAIQLIELVQTGRGKEGYLTRAKAAILMAGKRAVDGRDELIREARLGLEWSLNLIENELAECCPGHSYQMAHTALLNLQSATAKEA